LFLQEDALFKGTLLISEIKEGTFVFEK